MASGAAGIACKVWQLHTNLLKRFPDLYTLPNEVRGHLTKNEAIQLVASGLVSAWKHYGNNVKHNKSKNGNKNA